MYCAGGSRLWVLINIVYREQVVMYIVFHRMVFKMVFSMQHLAWRLILNIDICTPIEYGAASYLLCVYST